MSVRIVAVSKVVASAEEWPDWRSGARVKVQREGGDVGESVRVLSRVIRADWPSRPPRTPSGLVDADGWPLDILLVTPA